MLGHCERSWTICHQTTVRRTAFEPSLRPSISRPHRCGPSRMYQPDRVVRGGLSTDEITPNGKADVPLRMAGASPRKLNESG